MNKEKNIDKAKTNNDFTNKFRSIKINPWMAGAVIGFLAASLQTIASMTKPSGLWFLYGLPCTRPNKCNNQPAIW